jgi:hypothetical protein
MSAKMVACVAAGVCLLFLPAAAPAQTSDAASITGVVRDTSGAVLPASPSRRRVPRSSSACARASPTARGSTGSSICAPAATR